VSAADRAMQSARTVAEELLLASGAACALFHGNSLLPLLRDGDALDVRRASWDEVRPGDLVVYRYEVSDRDRHRHQKGWTGLPGSDT
jgi:hypothetical protein